MGRLKRISGDKSSGPRRLSGFPEAGTTTTRQQDSDSFSVFDWEAEPGSEGEYPDYTALLHMVPDVKGFEAGVQEMNLSEPGYGVRVNDESNGLLDDGTGADKPAGTESVPQPAVPVKSTVRGRPSRMMPLNRNIAGWSIRTR